MMIKRLLFSAAILVLLICTGVRSANADTGAEPKWSPDGKKILYVDGYFPDGREIMIMNADGSGKKKLTSNNFADEYPTLSPDGKTILFCTNRTGNGWKLFLMEIDGSNQRDLGLPITSSDPDDTCRAEWSPDGKLIVFPLTRDHKKFLQIVNRDGTGLREIPNGRGGYPHCSPDGKSLVFFTNGNIHTMNIDGSNRKQVTNNDPAAATRPNYPQWSPDGRHIFYLKGDHIFRINPDGTGEKQITNTAGMKWYLGVSTRGRMVYDTADEKDGKLGRIYSLEMDGSGLTLLTK
jgi:Tol biopolymer transport system component